MSRLILASTTKASPPKTLGLGADCVSPAIRQQAVESFAKAPLPDSLQDDNQARRHRKNPV
jgi:hypothetical protein